MNEPKLKKSELLALESIIEHMKENNETNLAFIGSIARAATSIGRAVAAGAGAAVGEAAAVGTGITKAAEAAGSAVGDAATAVGSAATEAAATSELAAMAADGAEAAAMIAALAKQSDISELKPVIDVLKNTELMKTSFSLKELENLRDKLKGLK
ncbi:hypothetical protein KCTC32516_02413 [Polaribacter huanghezhanensis]|uniref:hypothetical protein n=1 Tax=Polaribacter huanghezhanensis TaxID=1354726 RepID=UPI00264992E2|nr:hypothetical protein [Polaribacter huanghezhanensis]WKD87033.1 hypothetical protein KCTC32516_02413 [Polaribacter huanghezhanensis]